MLERIARGALPEKHHLALRAADGSLRYEECWTREGFDGPYTILYHQHRPQALRALPHPPRPLAPRDEPLDPVGLRRRHFRSEAVAHAGSLYEARVPLLHNEDVVISLARPTRSDAKYFVNADADELLFIRKGKGVVRSVLGDLAYHPLDYVFLPKGMLYRVELEPESEHEYLSIECRGGLDLPAQFRNRAGQLRMDAPYCHRDFRKPSFTGPRDENIREVLIKRDQVMHAFESEHSPLDVVGWDGSLYPWAFPILAFQPRVGLVHLPPTWHGTFAAQGALICSFVPRPLDFHKEAIPCPYPHASVDIDEVLYYVSGDFTSRTGVGPGSLTLHPRGIPHGPQPGRYEASLGATHTEELAVMLDCQRPLHVTSAARGLEDPGYDDSFGTPDESAR